MNQLRIFFRQHQLTDIDNGNQNIIVDCGTIATYIPGDVDPNWIEVTEFTEGLEKFQSSWDSVNQGNNNTSAANEAGSNYDKGISLSLTFYDTAFNFIWDWLLTTKCQILNAIDVRIDDVINQKSFRLFEIKCDNLKYQPEFDCRIEVQLREQDLTWHCVHKTFIWDDWDGFATTKDHPAFVTCIEPRPRIMSSVRMALMLFYYSNPPINLTGDGIYDDAIRIMEMNNFVTAPLIRDYIDNVAGKCGLSVDTIFHREGTPEYNACIYHPESGTMYENDGKSVNSPSTKFIFENRWDVTLAELLDKLKIVYGSEWYVTPNNTVIFKPIQELVQVAPIADFTTGLYPIRNLTYTFDGTKKPAFGRYQYQTDGADLGSQEISNLYNDLTDFDGPSNNPMLEGELNKSLQFAPTAFIRDGRTKDYISVLINDAAIGAFVLMAIITVVASTASLVTFAFFAGVAIAWGINIENWRVKLNRRLAYEDSYYTGTVRLVTANQTMTPRILIWDGVSKQSAKVVKTNNPGANAYYNPDAVPYATKNPIGIDNPLLNIFNYQSYFDSNFTGNLFDRFHDNIDNPLKSLETNQDFDFDTDLCLDLMNILGLWEGDFVKIGYLLVLERRANYTVYGRIENIAISYDDYTIKIKGKVIKNLAFLPPDIIPAPADETAFTFVYGETELITTGTPPDIGDYVGSIDTGITSDLLAAGSDITVTFTNLTDKVLFIEVPATQPVFNFWSVVGDPLQQNQPIDATFGGGGNVWFRVYVGSGAAAKNIYFTKAQTSFGGPVKLSR